MTRIALLLEDRLSDMLAAQTLLREMGWEIYSASTIADGAKLTRAWLSPDNQVETERILILLDLIMDMHGLHLAAVLRDEQVKGVLRPAAIVALTASTSRENRRLARVAGCDAVISKPLNADRLAEIEAIHPSLSVEHMTEDEIWLREWLVQEGRQMLQLKLARRDRHLPQWTAAEIEALLKMLSGRGWQPEGEIQMRLMERIGGREQGRTALGGLVPSLIEPYGQLLRLLLSGNSIEQCSKLLGYSRSHTYLLFGRLADTLAGLLNSVDVYEQT